MSEWTTWLGALVGFLGLVGIWFYTAAELVEFGGRVTAMGGIVAGIILILKRAKDSK